MFIMCRPAVLSASNALVDYMPWLLVVAFHLVSFVSVLYHSSSLMVKLFGK